MCGIYYFTDILQKYPMINTYLTEDLFYSRFSKELNLACSVYVRRKESGMKEYTLATYDFIFMSDKKSNLESLGEFLTKNYGYAISRVDEVDGNWELAGEATEFPVDEHNLMYWVIDLYCKGYQFDCILDGYGALADPKNQIFPIMAAGKDKFYFDLAMEAYDKENFGLAIIHFSTAIKINPNDPNSWYSRAIAKDKLHTLKAARNDYDKAIELAPDFVDAIVNRAANKDEMKEYDGAIEDYNLAIAIRPKDEIAYFNRGNTKFNKNDKDGACKDWMIAKELGAEYAQERLDYHCRS